VKNNRTIKGFILSLLLHLFLFWLFFVSFKKMSFLPPPSSGHEKKISLNLSQFQPPAPKPLPPQPKPAPPVAPPEPVAKPVVKKETKPKKPPTPVAEKKAVQKEKGFEVVQKSKEDNNVTKVAKQKPKRVEKKKVAKVTPKKVKKKKRSVQKKPLPTHFRLPRKSKDQLANALLSAARNPPHSRTAVPVGGANRMIDRLYGREFYSYTKTQQKFIRDHLSEIYRITQNTLYINGYPDVAVRMQQQGVNVVSFYLHPNGSISHLRLVKPMGYDVLDKNTISVIQIAYKDYPRPKTKTKIVFYVNYRLY